MSKLMFVCGIVLAAVGAALAVVAMASPGQMQVYGLTPETAATLLTGGILSLGLGGLLARLEDVPLAQPQPGRSVSMFDKPAGPALGGLAAGTAIAAEASARSVASATTETVAETISGAKSSVAETIEALEQAKSDIRAALGGAESMGEPDLPPLPVRATSGRPSSAPSEPSAVQAPEPPVVQAPAPAADPVPEPEPEPEAEAETGLFVVEEQTVRGKPARLLSDGTVEAETEEGWMRFENMEHLNEYLDSVGAK